MASTSMAATCHHLHHYLFLPKSSFSTLLTPNSISLSLIPKPHFRISLSPTSFQTLAAIQIQQDDHHVMLEDDDDIRVPDEDEIEVEEEEIAVEKKVNVVSAKLLPSLSMKEKKELSTYAHGLGDKLKSQLVGKSGVTDSVAASFVENLESNELLKIKIHRTCPGELTDVVKHLQQATASVVISQIGRTVILYKPSLTKLKAEEKKMQNRKVFVRKTFTLKPTLPSRKNTPILPRLSGRGHRGGNRI